MLTVISMTFRYGGLHHDVVELFDGPQELLDYIREDVEMWYDCGVGQSSCIILRDHEFMGSINIYDTEIIVVYDEQTFEFKR